MQMPGAGQGLGPRPPYHPGMQQVPSFPSLTGWLSLFTLACYCRKRFDASQHRQCCNLSRLRSLKLLSARTFSIGPQRERPFWCMHFSSSTIALLAPCTGLQLGAAFCRMAGSISRTATSSIRSMLVLMPSLSNMHWSH